jgi:CheY-like chemotaxis protein
LPTVQSRRVLIAEEDKMVADLFSLSLREMGCHVKIECKELQIRDAVTRWKPDLLLLDLFLPGCSGLALLREFSQTVTKAGKQLPILVVSSLGFKEVVEQARKLGAVDFVLKPVDLDNFRQKALTYLM